MSGSKRSFVPQPVEAKVKTADEINKELAEKGWIEDDYS